MLSTILTGDAAVILAVAFAIGIVVGITGMGGGALMTPALVLCGIPPAAAIANDLVAASVTKSVGAAVHWKKGSANTRLVLYLMIGSVPTAFAGAFILSAFGEDALQQKATLTALGVAILGAAIAYAARHIISASRRSRHGETTDDGTSVTLRPAATIAAGAVGGLLVGLTSVGSGSVIMVVLLLLYPTMSAIRLVGTDLLQAVPLVIAAAISHVIVTGVDWAVLIPLLIGGTPGTFLGAKVAHRIAPSFIRYGMIFVLTLTGLKMLGASVLGLVSAALALLIIGGPIWLWIERRFRPDPPHSGDARNGDTPEPETPSNETDPTLKTQVV